MKLPAIVSPIRISPIKPIVRTIFTLIVVVGLMVPAFLSITESAKAETYLFDGTTTTNLNVVETTTVHVSGLSMSGLPNGSKFIYNMTIPTTYSDDGFSQSISNVILDMATSPTGVPSTFSDQVDSFGNHYRRYIFNLDGFSGPSLYITCTASFNAVLRGNAGKVNYTDALGTAEQSQYLAATSAVQAGDYTLISKNNDLLSGVTTEAAAVDKIMNFVKTQIPNQATQTAPGSTAVSSLYITTGTCVNRAYLALGLLRSAGIPSRYVTGMLYGNTITYHINNGGYTQTNWGSGLHAWVEVYYPQEHVWVPYDPYMDKGFLDTRHIESGISMDGNVQDRANHGDFNLAFASGVNPGVQAIISNAISVSSVQDNPQLTYLYTKANPSGQVMYARDMQFSPANIPSVTPTAHPTPTIAPNNTTTVTPKPNATLNKPSPTPTVVPGSGARYKLSGTIIDAATGAAIPNATIMLDAIQVTANPAGKFTFIDALATGTYNLSIVAPGYAPDVRTISANNTDMDLTIKLNALSASPTSSSDATPTPSPASGILLTCVAVVVGGWAMLLWRKRGL